MKKQKYRKAKRLKKASSKLSEKELFLIEKTYGLLSAKKISEILNTGINKVYSAAKDLNVFNKKKLTEKDKRYILKNYHLGPAEIAKKLNYSSESIRQFASKNKLTRRVKYFSEKEIDFIKSQFPIIGCRAVSKKLNRPEISVSNQAKKLGLTKSVRDWSEIEDNFLRNNLNLPIKELSHKIGRTYYSVVTRRKQLGLSQPRKK